MIHMLHYKVVNSLYLLYAVSKSHQIILRMLRAFQSFVPLHQSFFHFIASSRSGDEESKEKEGEAESNSLVAAMHIFSPPL